MMTRAMPSTPTAGMETLMGLVPIDCYMKKEALLASIRLKASGQWKYKEGETISENAHARLAEKWGRNIRESNLPQDKLRIKVKLKAEYTTRIQKRDEVMKEDTKPMPKDKETISCFTDGSKTEKGTGAGFSIMGDTTTRQESTYLGEHTTVYQAEIIAIAEASIALIQDNTRSKEVNFFIDNQSAISSLGSYITRNNTTLECKKTFKQIGKTRE